MRSRACPILGTSTRWRRERPAAHPEDALRRDRRRRRHRLSRPGRGAAHHRLHPPRLLPPRGVLGAADVRLVRAEPGLLRACHLLRQARRGHVRPHRGGAGPRGAHGRHPRRHGRLRHRPGGAVRDGRGRRPCRPLRSHTPGPDGGAHLRRDALRPLGAGLPLGEKDREETEYARVYQIWGDEDHCEEFALLHFGDDPLVKDRDFGRWLAKAARFAGTPKSMRLFDQAWYETDVRDVLPSIHVPTLLPCPTVPARLGRAGDTALCGRADPGFAAGHVPGPVGRHVRGVERGACRRGAALPRLGAGGGSRPRPHARHRALHRRRRLDRQGVRGGRRALDGAPREAQRDGPAPSSPATAAPRSRRWATASSPPSTDRPGR